MLGWVAAVSATESPSQLRPALIQRMCMTVAEAGAALAGVTNRIPLGKITRSDGASAALLERTLVVYTLALFPDCVSTDREQVGVRAPLSADALYDPVT